MLPILLKYPSFVSSVNLTPELQLMETRHAIAWCVRRDGSRPATWMVIRNRLSAITICSNLAVRRPALLTGSRGDDPAAWATAHGGQTFKTPEVELRLRSRRGAHPNRGCPSASIARTRLPSAVQNSAPTLSATARYRGS